MCHGFSWFWVQLSLCSVGLLRVEHHTEFETAFSSGFYAAGLLAAPQYGVRETREWPISVSGLWCIAASRACHGLFPSMLFEFVLVSVRHSDASVQICHQSAAFMQADSLEFLQP